MAPADENRVQAEAMGLEEARAPANRDHMNAEVAALAWALLSDGAIERGYPLHGAGRQEN